MEASSYSVGTAMGRMTMHVRETEGRPFDVFVVLGRSGSDVTAFTEAIGRLLSIALRSNIPVEILAENLIGLGARASLGFGPDRVSSVPDAIGRILERYYCSAPLPRRRAEICPSCGNATLEHNGGCLECSECGYSEC